MQALLATPMPSHVPSVTTKPNWQRLMVKLMELVRASYLPGSRKLVTNHDALGYFADRYGFEIIGTVLPIAHGSNI